MKAKVGDFVLPGDFLAVSEEFIPAEGAYDDNGNIKSLVVGTVERDDKNKRISVVSPTKSLPILKKDSHIIGQIMEVRGQRALVKIKSLKENDRGLQASFVGGIHVSQAQKGYLAKLTDAFHIGDIIEAKITKVVGLDNIDLKTSQKDLGVVKAMCTRCRHFMEKTSKNEVTCPNCEKREKRKLSINYEG
ncbi:exosome complex RNA-binding protein Csl4 [Methanobacterium alcaliphilum]|uniref:exosome complex RNA-binding protein Csl4 n=1 Tax=Methanobacterium alcaliphilum TaxID=392018 RepID=UPI00200ACEF0|nr:exosome complex RNA-binding protein Csl4 [Methanobacterium alcaliphilum]MCK9151015.1 exosome complex RNA-binding protein Csl4 [Methanobacterium alcaliphilum]